MSRELVTVSRWELWALWTLAALSAGLWVGEILRRLSGRLT